ncbi:hypothetical protein AVEN_185071-1 [Araneus ventricosus]|uniref:Uncharacterized protein n=1 Tax=Araneus ventricosus TaxID=182803 RepID=A0A4Y2BR37_ARAVE|nr:hypothetical protein AVEN_185071-1 [Araneus ventricosus]
MSMKMWRGSFEVDSVKNKNNTAMNCDEDEDEEDGNDHDAEINKPSKFEDFHDEHKSFACEDLVQILNQMVLETDVSDFHLFRELKTVLGGQNFHINEKLQDSLQTNLNMLAAILYDEDNGILAQLYDK